MRIPSRVLLRLEEGVKVPEAAAGSQIQRTAVCSPGEHDILAAV